MLDEGSGQKYMWGKYQDEKRLRNCVLSKSLCIHEYLESRQQRHVGRKPVLGIVAEEALGTGKQLCGFCWSLVTVERSSKLDWLTQKFLSFFVSCSSYRTTGRKLSSPYSDPERFQPAAVVATLFLMMTTRWCLCHQGQGQCDSGVL